MNAADLREKVRRAYTAAAEEPGASHPFPVGRLFAESLGYPPDWLREVPAASIEAFTGVSNVASFADVPADGILLDLGCGAGLDSLLLARRLGDGGQVIGIDFSFPMLQRARCAAGAAASGRVLFCQSDGERLPLPDGAIDVAVVNGIFNLNPARDALFRELARCVRPGGRVYGAELILREALPPEGKVSEANWFA